MIFNLSQGDVVQLTALPAGVSRTLTNVGNQVIFYGDQNVSSTNNAGSLVPGASVILTGAPYVVCVGGSGEISDEVGIHSEGSWATALAGLTSTLPGINVMDSKYGAKGNGVTDDTAAIQAAVSAASANYLATGARSLVLFPAGFSFKFGTINIASGMILWAYGARLIQSGTLVTAWIKYPGNSVPAVLQGFEIRGGDWFGTGNEGAGGANGFLFSNGVNTGGQDVVLRDMTINNWGFTSYYVRTSTRVQILDNKIIHLPTDKINNPGFQNEISFDAYSAFGGQIIVSGNMIRNAIADAIAIVVIENSVGGPFYFQVTNNLVTADAPTVHAGCTFTNGSNVVLDAGAVASDVGRYVTSGRGNILKAVYIQSCVPGVSYTLFSGGVARNYTGATGTGNLYVGVSRGSVGVELDSALSTVSDILIANNNITGYERAQVFMAGVGAANKNIVRASIHGNLLTNGQLEADAAFTQTNPQGIGIGLSGGNEFFDVNIADNIITVASPVPEINIQGSASLVNYGRQTGNRLSYGPAQGRATLVAGTVTVPTTEIRATDKVWLSVGAPAGTRGEVQIGTIINGTLTATFTSGSAAVTLAAGSIAVPATGAVLGISDVGGAVPGGATLTVTGATTGTLSVNATATVATEIVKVGSFVINSIQPGTASTIQAADTSGVDWKIEH